MPGYRVQRVKVVEPRSSWRPPIYGEMWRSGGSGRWLLGCPACGRVASLSHGVVVREGRPTILPSVVCPEPSCGAHYHVVDGEVQPC